MSVPFSILKSFKELWKDDYESQLYVEKSSRASDCWEECELEGPLLHTHVHVHTYTYRHTHNV